MSILSSNKAVAYKYVQLWHLRNKKNTGNNTNHHINPVSVDLPIKDTTDNRFAKFKAITKYSPTPTPPNREPWVSLSQQNAGV